MNIYKIKDSLFIVGNKIISYETHVATIKGNKIIERGRFSRTTSKHINFVSKLISLEVVYSKVDMKESFSKYDLGTFSNRMFDNTISIKSSRIILEHLFTKNIPYEIVVASLQNKINKKDWEKIEKPKKMTKKLTKGVKLLSRLDIF